MLFIIYFLFFSLGQCSVDFDVLLSFKDSVFDPSNSLSSWVNSSSPCSDSWYGVTCNPTTHRITRLVLDNMNISGSTQSLSQLSQLRLLSLKNNRLFSSSSFNVSSWRYIRHLYLSGNHFSGVFPTGISTLRRLHRLDLSHNNFHGGIPMAKLTRLPFLLTLRLESNSFSGPLNSIALSSSMLDFNVSNNKLSGKIPTWMSRFPASSFEGNKDLCGQPLPSVCFNPTALPAPLKQRMHHPESKRLSDRVVLMIIAVDVVAVTAALFTITWCCCRYKCCSGGAHKGVLQAKSGSKLQRRSWSRKREVEAEEMVVFEGCKGFIKVGDLLKSSAQLLGKGSLGTTYKVLMDGGDVVVVKRVRQRRKRRKDVDGWLRVMGGLRHTNIVNLIAYYNSKDELLLVYDFLPNGSLHSLLHGNRGPGRTPLSWSTRLKLAGGAAQALAFIHGYSKAKIFHGHLTSSNIIVDRQGNACISDCGLHQVVHATSLSNDDYKAPELMLNNGEDGGLMSKYTQKCDVYSFGVILLEILTGKMVSGESGMSLVKWIQSVGKAEWAWEVFDFEMLGDREMEEEMVDLMQVALFCVASLPKDRPKMSMVHRMIEDVRTKGARNGGTICILNDFSSDSSPALSERTISFK
ncbi:probable leucine-rich repeat receptor-like protein kinase At1g68400 [Durio zibethinus]|uniref:Probable leucine-rich repeat receptor-like protein kinase At1g68400 n=1 Tax=Durio zibethinus TaxID=66656 RepID=A0A6P5ZB67_DURZI|nr:probable leucine-rich repeat receptor-like protein kinase At1g68400 [Durio zibethinus]